MRKVLLSVAALGTLATAMPAAAQWQGERHGNRYEQGRWGGYGSIGGQLSRIAERIDRGYQRGALTAGEARSLRRELDQIARTERRYRSNGLSRYEHEQLQRRIAYLQDRVRDQRRDDDRRYYRR